VIAVSVVIGGKRTVVGTYPTQADANQDFPRLYVATEKANPGVWVYAWRVTPADRVPADPAPLPGLTR
jgi:hypothetical protein